MTRLGADVAGLDRLAAEVARQADALATMRVGLDAAVGTTIWLGGDADRFRTTWRRVSSRLVGEVAAGLHDVARQLGRQADEQRRASAATGGSGGFGAGPGRPQLDRVGAVPALPSSQASPAQVASWWAGLSPDERAAVLAADPEALGRLDGLPAAVRDEANRAVLANDLERLPERIAALQGSNDPRDVVARMLLERELANARHTRDYLAKVEGRVDPITGDPMVAQLYVYAPGAFAGDGRVAIAHGDLDTARHVAVSVPGITNDVGEMSPGNANNLYDESRYASGQGVAVVNWMGYDAPSVAGLDIGGTVSRNMAVAGARYLTADIAGLRASWAGNDPPTHLTVVAHSYGSTTASWAAASMGMKPDDLVLIGSPGAGPAQNAGDFTTGPRHTYVGSASRDPVTMAGETGWTDPTRFLAPAINGELLGNDPSEDDFGAVRFQAERPGRTWTSGEHSNYFASGSESLYNISAVVGGHPDQVSVASPRYDPLMDVDVGVDVDVDAHADVDVGVGIQRGPFGVPLPDVDVNVDAGVSVDVDAHADVDVAMQDPEAGRTPTTGHSHRPSW